MITGTERDNELYRKDAFAQAWVDRRYIATLIKWMEEQGIQPRFMAEVVNTALVSLVEALVSQGRVSRVQFTKEADQIINRTIGVNLNPSKRGRKNYQYNLEIDDSRLEAWGRPSPQESGLSAKQESISQDLDEAMRKEAERILKGEG